MHQRVADFLKQKLLNSEHAVNFVFEKESLVSTCQVDMVIRNKNKVPVVVVEVGLFCNNVF